ncbi:Transposase DDE domain-containing protein [Streptomyces sp. 1222.2]|nr:Transposase DDE domain-containing protein [Streptomyces sp. 1222.2]
MSPGVTVSSSAPCRGVASARFTGPPPPSGGAVTRSDRLLLRQGGPARPESGPSPVDRARPGSKHHVLTYGQGIPLAVSLTGGNRNGITQLLPLLDTVPAMSGLVGRRRRRPDALLADRGYDHDTYRRLLRARGIRPVIAERGQPHGFGLGIFRDVVERTIDWLHGFRRLRIRWERRDDIHEALLGLAACLITHRHVQRLCQDLRAALPRPDETLSAAPRAGSLARHRRVSNFAGQRALPRGFKGTAGSCGAGSGAPSYPFTSPNRDPSIQSRRACSISSWDRPIQYLAHQRRTVSRRRRSRRARAWVPRPRGRTAGSGGTATRSGR